MLTSPGLVRTEKVEIPEVVLPSQDVLDNVPQILRNATIGDPKSWNPILAKETSTTDAIGPLFESLVRRNPFTLEFDEYSPVLATSWEVDSTGKVWTFHLRKGVKWNDGELFTAKDVKFTLDVIYDENIPNSMSDILTIEDKKITCRVIDDYTIEFTTPVPFAPFLHCIGGMEIIPEHVLGKAWQKGKFNQMWTIDTPVGQIIGTGPYVITEYGPAQYIKYERNPLYWRKDEKGRPLPYIEKIQTLIVENQETTFLKFQAGETDIYGPRPQDISWVKRNKDIIELKEIGLNTGTTFVAFNRNPRHYAWYKVVGAEEINGKVIEKIERVVNPKLNWFSDPEFMKAIAYSIDDEIIIQNVLYGLGEPTVTVISPMVHIFHNDSLQDYEYDLEKAKQKLEAAGYIDRDGDGIREDKDGNKIEFNFTTNSGVGVRESMCNIIKEDWKKLGFKVQYQPLEFNTLVEKLTNNYDWDVVLIGLTGSGVEPHGGANVYKSSGQLHLWNPCQDTPATDWEKEVDELVERGAKEFDLEKRVEIYKRLQEIFYQQLPYIMLPCQKVFVSYYKKLKNYFPMVFGTYKSECQYIDTAEE